MAPILSFDTARGVSVAVTGVDDQALVTRIADAARRCLKHLVGKWSVSIAPARSRGQWRMELRGTAGIHVWLFAAARESLPQRTGERLAAFLASVSRRP
jgi:hypothetical protein